jgi:acetyl esterase
LHVDPAVLAALAATPSTLPADVDDIDIAVLREQFEIQARLSRSAYPPDLEVTHHSIVANDRDIGVRVYRPRSDTPLPGLLYMHGGGWVIGSVESHDAITAELAHRSRVVVCSIDYALAPERPYPAAIEDVEAASAWLTGTCASLGIDGARLGIGGDSAGAHLAALYGVRAALAGRASPYRCQLLFYPVVDGVTDTPSYAANAEAPILSAALMRWFIRSFVPSTMYRDPRAFPLHAPEFARQPETYIATAGHDPLRDEGLDYAGRLAAAGVTVTLRHAADLVHGFLRLREASARAQAEFELACSWLSRTL